MELTRLSQITGDLVYYNVALRIQDSLSKYQGEYGSLVPHFLSPDGNHAGDFTIGGMIDR
jgi:mannosyl-oligosaccharide alpha-1,2-mannosidase